jgi:hypothetical protein
MHEKTSLTESIVQCCIDVLKVLQSQSGRHQTVDCKEAQYVITPSYQLRFSRNGVRVRRTKGGSTWTMATVELFSEEGVERPKMGRCDASDQLSSDQPQV